MRSDDLSTLFLPTDEEQDFEFSQGTVREWNPTTNHSLVVCGQGMFSDLPILGASSLTGLRVGDAVGVLRFKSSRFILGKISFADVAQVQPGKLSDNSVTTNTIEAGAITNPKVDVDAISTANIQGQAVDLSKLADGSVDATKIVLGSVGSPQLTDEVNNERDQNAADAAQAISAATDAMTTAQTAQATADNAIRTYYAADPPWADGTTQPDSSLGDLWYDTGNDVAHRWNGTIWAIIQDDAISQALAKAQDALTTADGKIVTYYQGTPPTGGAIGDLWFDTSNDNRVYWWSGSAWSPVQMGSGALQDNAVTTQQLADGSVSAAKIVAGSIGNGLLADDAVDASKLADGSVDASSIVAGSVGSTQLASAVNTDISTAQSAASNAQTDATQAQSDASAAQTDADSAQLDATQALSDANNITADQITDNAIIARTIAAQAIGTQALAADSVTATIIAANAVATQHLQADSVDANIIAANAVGASQLIANSVIAGKVAADAIGSRELIANTVKAGHIVAGAVGVSELAANSVVAGKVAADAISAENIQAATITTNLVDTNAITGDKLSLGSGNDNLYSTDYTSILEESNTGYTFFAHESVSGLSAAIELDFNTNGLIKFRLISYDSSNYVLSNAYFAEFSANSGFERFRRSITYPMRTDNITISVEKDTGYACALRDVTISDNATDVIFDESGQHILSIANLTLGGTAPFRIDDPNNGSMVMDQNEIRHLRPDGSVGDLFINSSAGSGFSDVGSVNICESVKISELDDIGSGGPIVRIGDPSSSDFLGLDINEIQAYTDQPMHLNLTSHADVTLAGYVRVNNSAAYADHPQVGANGGVSSWDASVTFTNAVQCRAMNRSVYRDVACLSVNTHSDPKAKADIEPVGRQKALSDVMSVPVYKYHHTHDPVGDIPKMRRGVMATDVPDEVRTEIDGDEMIDLGGLVATLWGAVQELSEQIQDMKPGPPIRSK